MNTNNPRIICLGNFDGVHLGHRALFERALQIRDDMISHSCVSGQDNYSTPPVCGVLTFTQPTYAYLRSDPPPRITNGEMREKLIRKAGMQFVITLDFADVMDMPPEKFVREVLIEKYHCIMTVCGYNFRFGCRGTGDSTQLYELMNGHSVTVEPVRVDGNIVSSTAIRSAITDGDMQSAARMLGRPYSIENTVQHGHGVGSGLGFATVNQHFEPGFLVPAAGVYASRCIIDGVSYAAVSNVGCRPTFGDGDPVLCETHIIGLCADLYGKTIRTELHLRLRPEQRFNSAEELAAAIRHDIESAAEYFSANC